MNNDENTPNQNFDNINPPQYTQPVPPQQPSHNDTAPVKRKRLIYFLLPLLCLLFFGLGFLTGALVNKQPSKKTVVTVTKTQEKKATTSPGFRGGPNGVELTKNVDSVVSEILDSLALTYKQSGQYPSHDAVQPSMQYVDQIIQKYGYSEELAGPNVNCPKDNGYFSYMAYANQTTGKYDSFDLYYCNGSEKVKKDQTDITNQ